MDGLVWKMYLRHACYGHCLTVEVLKRNLARQKMLIHQIIDDYNYKTVLYCAASQGYINEVKLFLEVAGNDALKLLTVEARNTRNTKIGTVLHLAIVENFDIGLVKLLLGCCW